MHKCFPTQYAIVKMVNILHSRPIELLSAFKNFFQNIKSDNLDNNFTSFDLSSGLNIITYIYYFC